MTSVRSLLPALGVACALVVCPGLPAGAAEQPDPRRLVRGAESTVPHLQDGVIRVGKRTVSARVPVAFSGQKLLGRAGRAWLVHSTHRYDSYVHAVRPGRTARVVPGGRPGPSVGRSVRLSRGGQLLVTTTEASRGGTTTNVVRLADGKRLGIAPWNSEDVHPTSPPLDAQGVRILVTVGVPHVWNPVTDRARRLPVGRSSGALMADDVIFVEKGRCRFGPTSIQSPGEPAWAAKYFVPHDVSPDGTLVLGRQNARSGGRQVLQLRRMSDGEVLRSWAYGARYRSEHTARFEDDARVVFEVTRGGVSALVRCRVSGPCTRASGLGGTISFPHEP